MGQSFQDRLLCSLILNFHLLDNSAIQDKMLNNMASDQGLHNLLEKSFY